MRKNIIVLGLLLSALLPMSLRAQVDPHFSQYYAYPLWLNPALTGVLDGDYRVSGNYRNQWNGFGDAFSTAGVSFDAATDKNIGVGVNILNMSAGDAGYNYLNAMASISYSGVKFGATGTSRLVFGVQAGIINRKLDPAKFQTGSQWNPVLGYDPSIFNGENLNKTNSTAFDASAGVLFFDGNPNHRLNPFVGFSAAHLTQPEDPFVANDNRNYPIRYLAHGGTKIKMTEELSLTPHGLYMRQGNAEEKVLGIYGQYAVNPEFDLLAGGTYRFDDSVIPFAGFHYKNFVLGLSYDANVSNLQRLVNGSNSFEVSLSFISRKRRVLTEEYFICPRL
jgi:type IX secretion system PorP/SprF family membrane protein